MTTHMKKNDKKICSIKDSKKRCSLDEAALRKNSPRGNKELSGSGGSSVVSGFDSDSGEKRGFPLPEPCASYLGAGGGIGGASGGVGGLHLVRVLFQVLSLDHKILAFYS